MDAAKVALSEGVAGPDLNSVAPNLTEANHEEEGKKSGGEISAWKRSDEEGQRRAVKGASNLVVVRPPLAVASIFLNKEQRRRQKEELQLVENMDGHPQFDNQGGAPAKEGTPRREGTLIPEAPKADAEVKAGVPDPSARLAPLFLPRKTRGLKEKSFSKGQETQVNPGNAGLLDESKGMKRKRVEKRKVVLVVAENEERPQHNGEAERGPQNGSLEPPRIQAADAKLAEVAEPLDRVGLPESETVLAGGVKSMETVLLGDIQMMGEFVEDRTPLNAAGEEGILGDEAAEKSTGKEPSGSAGVVERVETAGPLMPAQRKRGRPRKGALSEAPKTGNGASERFGRGKGDAAGLSKDAKAQGQANEGEAQPVVSQGHVEADPNSDRRPPVYETHAPSQGASFEKQNCGGVGGGMQQVEIQPSSGLLQGAGQSVKAAVDTGAQQTVMKVPDIFLTANERKRRLQEAKKEEKRLQEEAAAAAEEARLEREALLLRAKEDKKREAEEKRQRAREERAKQAEEKKRLAREERAKAADERKLKGGKEKKVGAASAEWTSNMETGHDAGCEAAEGGTPAKKKRGRPRKVKMGSGTGPDVVVVLSGSEKEEMQEAPSLMDTMRKRQEDLRASIRESQEAHAKLNAGKATHPFFKRKQGPPAADVTPVATEAAPAKETKPSLAPLDPLHVTQRHEEDAPPVLWPERLLRLPEAPPSSARLETHAPVCLLEPADPGTSRSRVPGCGTQPSLAQRQESALGALLALVQAKSDRNDKDEDGLADGEDWGEASEAVRQLTTEEALRRRFEWYKARSAEAQPNEAELGPETVSRDVSGTPLTDALWCFKYRALSSQEVCGNRDGVAFIRDWLAEWTARIAREQKKKLLTSQPPPKRKAAAKKWQASEESSDWLVSGGASDSDLRDDEDGLANVLLVSGPTGVGKTAAVYALAEELGFHILESNPSEKRSRATILQRFGEATESKGLLKGNTALAAKTDPAKTSNALLETWRKSATAKAVARQPNASAPKRNTRKRAKVAGGLFAASRGGSGPSGSKVSVLVGSESSGSFCARGKGRKRRRKGGPAQDATGGEHRAADAVPQLGMGRVQEAADGMGGEAGESAGAKRPRKRRKTVGFVGLGKSGLEGETESLNRSSEGGHVAAERASEGGHVATDGTSEDAHVAGAPVMGAASPNGTRGVGPERGGNSDPATRNERGSRVPVSEEGGGAEEQLEEAPADPNGERAVSEEVKPVVGSGAFPPAYQRRHRGERGGEKSAPGGVDAGASLPSDTLSDGAMGGEVEIGDRQIGHVGTAVDEGVEKREELETGAGRAERPDDDAVRGETMAVSASVGVPADSDGRKRKTDGVRRRRSGKLSEGSPPAKKRRSFGSPAVLRKLRKRPCSLSEEQGPATAVPGGPVLDGDAGTEEVRPRKRVGKRRSSLGQGAKGGVAKKGSSVRGPVLAGVKADAGEKGPAKGRSGSSKALLLFEEVEQHFEEDKGFLSAVATLAASTKRPMILTCNDSLEILPGCDFRKLSVEFAAPPILDMTVHACLVAASEGSPVDPWVMERLVRVTKGDMRKVLLQAQLWSREPTPAGVHAEAGLPEPFVRIPAKGDASSGAHGTERNGTEEPQNVHGTERNGIEEPQNVAGARSAELGVASMGIEAQTPVQGAGSSKGPGQSELDRCPQPTHPRSLWPTGTVRELQLDAAHRSLPALADVALPCQLAAAVAAHQTLRTLRAAQTAESAAAVLATRIYGVLDAEEASAARIRRELQEAKAVAKATEKAELAERRRRAREAKRAAQRLAEDGNEVGETFGEGALLDDLEDVPIGRLSFCGNEAGVCLEAGHAPGARKRRRGRRRAIEEDDDISGGACDVTPVDGPAPELEKTTGRTGSLVRALEEPQVNQACGACGRTDGEEAMLLCDRGGCHGALHMYCADPPMAEVPEGDWFCAECSKGREDGVGRYVSERGESAGAREGSAEEGVKEKDLEVGGEEGARLGGSLGGEEESKAVSADERTTRIGGEDQRSAEGGGEGKRLAAEGEEEEQSAGDPADVHDAGGLKSPGVDREQGEIRGVEEMQGPGGREDEAQGGRAGTGPTGGGRGVEEKLQEGPVEGSAPQDGKGGNEQMGIEGRAGGARTGVFGGASLHDEVVGPVGRGSQPGGDADVSMGGVADVSMRGARGAPVAVAREPETSSDADRPMRQLDGAQFGATGAPVDAVDVPSELPGDLEPTTPALLTAEASALELAGAREPVPAGLEIPRDLERASSNEHSLAEIEPLRPDAMRGLVSAASRDAVSITAAIWGLTHDLSASELMSRSRGVDLAADATPCDELDLGVARQAAACLAYASLRWKVGTCHGDIGPEGGASDLRLQSTLIGPGAESEGELVRGDAQLLAAAGDEAALCVFCGRGCAGDRVWLRLRMGATTEQKNLERRTVDISLREVSHQEAAARRSAGLSCQVARVEYAGFLGKILTGRGHTA